MTPHRQYHYHTQARDLIEGWSLLNLDGSTTKIANLTHSDDGGVSFSTDNGDSWSVPGNTLVTVVSDN